MTKKIRTDAEEYNALMKIGLELEDPQDEFSYQPDSGGTANGEIGKQEYGIDIDIDARGREINDDGTIMTTKDSSLPIPGASEWSQKNRLPADGIGENTESNDDRLLVATVRDLLTHHPTLKHLPISIFAQNGTVTLRGEVPDDATKSRFRDVICEIPEITTVTNHLTLSML